MSDNDQAGKGSSAEDAAVEKFAGLRKIGWAVRRAPSEISRFVKRAVQKAPSEISRFLKWAVQKAPSEISRFLKKVWRVLAFPPEMAIPTLIAVSLSWLMWLGFAVLGPLNPYQHHVAFATSITTTRLNGFAVLFLLFHIVLEIYLWLGVRAAYFRSYLLRYRFLRRLSLWITAFFWVVLSLWLALLCAALIAPPAIVVRDILTAVMLFALGLRYFVITPLFFYRVPFDKKQKKSISDTGNGDKVQTMVDREAVTEEYRPQPDLDSEATDIVQEASSTTGENSTRKKSGALTKVRDLFHRKSRP